MTKSIPELGHFVSRKCHQLSGMCDSLRKSLSRSTFDNNSLVTFHRSSSDGQANLVNENYTQIENSLKL